MSQGHDSISTTTPMRKPRRTRQRRNQPVLVATTTIENSSQQGDKLTIDTETNTQQEIETATTSESLPEKQAQHSSHLPKFFSRVDKSEQKEEEIAKARLARANHNPDRSESTIKTKTKNETKQQSKTTERREPLFKIRHFVGMTIYLFGAQLILPYEFALAHQLGIDHPFYTLRIFNTSIALSSAIFLNIATLILLLYTLVKLDFLPNTASAKLRAEQNAREQQRMNRQHATPTVKNAPLPMKLGVKGQDDELYRAYRANQRREKKR